MAGTDEDGSTLIWLLLGATRGRVTEYTHGSQKRAEDILLDGLEWGIIRWRPSWQFRIQDPRWIWTPETAERFFWDRLGAGRIDVDWANHGAVRTGPAQVPMGEKGAQVLINGPQTIIEAPLILLCWNDVLDILQSLGLTLQSSDSAAASSPPAPALTPPQHSPPPPQQEPPPLSSVRPSPIPESSSPKKKWTKAEREEWRQQLLRQHQMWSNKMKWVSKVAFPKMQEDFGDQAPWSSVRSLYRRLFPRKTGRGRGRPRK